MEAREDEAAVLEAQRQRNERRLAIKRRAKEGERNDRKRQEKVGWLVAEQSAWRQTIASRSPKATSAGILFPDEAEEFEPLR